MPSAQESQRRAPPLTGTGFDKRLGVHILRDADPASHGHKRQGGGHERAD